MLQISAQDRTGNLRLQATGVIKLTPGAITTKIKAISVRQRSHHQRPEGLNQTGAAFLSDDPACLHHAPVRGCEKAAALSTFLIDAKKLSRTVDRSRAMR